MGVCGVQSGGGKGLLLQNLGGTSKEGGRQGKDCN